MYIEEIYTNIREIVRELDGRMKQIQTIHEFMKLIYTPWPQCKYIIDKTPPNGWFVQNVSKKLLLQFVHEDITEVRSHFRPNSCSRLLEVELFIEFKNVTFEYQPCKFTNTVSHGTSVMMRKREPALDISMKKYLVEKQHVSPANVFKHELSELNFIMCKENNKHTRKSLHVRR